MFDTREQPPPSPVSLRGMERPVRSFRSFIRTAPPPSRSLDDKPLPPTPVCGQTIFDLRPTSPPTASEQPATDTSWKAPAAWDDSNTPYKGLQAPSPYTTRNYAPLLPEPSPGVFEQLEPRSCSPAMSSYSNSRSGRVRSRADVIPSLPHRSPFRVSAFNTPSVESDTGPTLTSAFYNGNTPAIRTSSFSPDSFGSNIPASSTQQSDIDMRISNLSTKQKAFASLGIESPTEQDTSWDNWSGGPGTPLFRDTTRSPLPMQGHKIAPSSRGSPLPDDGTSFLDASGQLRQRSVSQDYHNILANQYLETHSYDATQSLQHKHDRDRPMPGYGATAKAPSNPNELVPRPLPWKKERDSSASYRPISELHPGSPSRPESSTRERRKSSWVPFHQTSSVLRRLSHDESNARPGVEGDVRPQEHESRRTRRSSKIDTRMSELKSNMRNFGTSMKPERASDTHTPPGFPYSSATPAVEPLQPLLNPPSRLPVPPPPPEPTPRQQITSFLNLSPTSTIETPRASPDIEPLEFEPIPSNWRRSSMYSQYTHASVAPGVAVRRNMHMRISSGSIPSTRTRSNPSSPATPTSPLAHEICFPRTPPPPPLPAYAPRILTSPSSQSPASYKSGEQSWLSRAGSDSEEEFPKRNIPKGLLGKAKGARKAWRNRQKDVKHEKLKASIRFVGPTDSTVHLGSVMRNGTILVDLGNVNRAPAHMGAGAF
jgi:hypothetical protein